MKGNRTHKHRRASDNVQSCGWRDMGMGTKAMDTKRARQERFGGKSDKERNVDDTSKYFIYKNTSSQRMII